jgi:Protein of unknown function (DUF4232)
MTNLPDDPIDPYEPRLTRRVGAFAEQAVRPIDAAAIATAARTGARRQTLAGRLFGSTAAMARLGVLLAGALVAVAAFGLYLPVGGGPRPLATGPAATPTGAPAAVGACTAEALSGLIMGWDGAAGHRIATISIDNGGSTACLLPRYLRPALIDGDGHALIVSEGLNQPAPIEFPAGATATSMVDMANYCGAAPTPADKPLKLRMYLPDESSIELPSAASLPLPADPPPCNGPNVPASIQMQALQLATPQP